MFFPNTMLDILDDIRTKRKDEIRRAIEDSRSQLETDKKGVVRFREPCESVSHLRAEFVDVSGNVVIIGRKEEISEKERKKVLKAMRAFIPWRKGPFSVFGIDINAEWRSERKWNRVLPNLPDLNGKIVADIGCNNGYYMFRMAHHKPGWVIGFDPYLQHYFTFKTLNSFAGIGNLKMELLGVEQIGLFEGVFDVIFLMGIIYHRASPVDVLKNIRKAMRPGGVIIVESQAIPGDDPVALFPEKRYAKAPGVYFVPTAACLKNWMVRTGFKNVEIFCTHPMSSLEQRRTDWMQYESFEDFIDTEDKSRTVEGYPAPIRVFLRAETV